MTALGIFRRGGFGPPHVLAVLTLVALAAGTLADRSRVFIIPAIAESSTRLPRGMPLVTSPDAFVLQAIDLGLLAVFLAAVTAQIRRLRRAEASAPPLAITSKP